jgi:FixJ family two-component response regulator
MNTVAMRVFVVDDESSVLNELSCLLRSAGLEATTYKSGEEFIAHHQPGTPGCLLLDLHLPGISGLELQQWLAQARDPMPIIFVAGQADIPSSVQAMKAGAVDFLTKPVRAQDLLDAVHSALQRAQETIAVRAELNAIEERLAALTPREREVLMHVVSGQLNKQIASNLGTVEKTIKVHRARVMQKMQAHSLAELVRMTERIGRDSVTLQERHTHHRNNSHFRSN